MKKNYINRLLKCTNIPHHRLNTVCRWYVAVLWDNSRKQLQKSSFFWHTGHKWVSFSKMCYFKCTLQIWTEGMIQFKSWQKCFIQLVWYCLIFFIIMYQKVLMCNTKNLLQSLKCVFKSSISYKSIWLPYYFRPFRNYLTVINISIVIDTLVFFLIFQSLNY